MSTTLTSKGQVTIPKTYRDYYGFKPGSRVRFEVNDAGQLVVSPEKPIKPRRKLDHLRGIGVSGMTTDEIMELTRGPDWKSPR